MKLKTEMYKAFELLQQNEHFSEDIKKAAEMFVFAMRNNDCLDADKRLLQLYAAARSRNAETVDAIADIFSMLLWNSAASPHNGYILCTMEEISAAIDYAKGLNRDKNAT